MYFQDLSKYEYEHLSCEANVQNVGWLEKGHDFPVGPVPIEFVAKLKTLSRRCRTNSTRGIHSCQFCADPDREIRIVDDTGKKRLLGTAEIWIPSVDGRQIFAMPDLIVHYVEEHGYLPPQQFVAAVQQFDVGSTWDSQLAFQSCLSAAGPTGSGR